ncbi:MAG TPA: DUF4259 domain-containing protein [Thermoleophilaceae bacterium]|jgi:hypothetical protein|nr:DUF4259 domain-containing protein [Thermoleophilaceae bacterium]
MGAWDLGPLDNDDALDFLGDLEEAPDALGALREALTLPAGYLEAPDGSIAIAAAAAVAVIRRGGVQGVAPQFGERINALNVSGEQADELAPLAVAALERVASEESELVELWDEAGETEAWRATLEPLRAGVST